MINTIHGILIRPDTHTVSDVCAAVWNGHEIRKKLLLKNDDIVYRDLQDDSIVIQASVNVVKSGERFRKCGFELFGDCYYGNALIVPDDGRHSPLITPERVSHVIRFFLVETGPRPVPGILGRGTNS